MKRLEFLKSLGLSAGGILIPNHYMVGKPIKIYDNFVRGLTHYHYKQIRKQIQEGDVLNLIREHENLYDSFAIQVHYQDKQIGFIAAYENIVIANMMDTGVALNAFVSKKNTKTHFAESLAI